jgi:PAS domain-containing protein
MLSAVLAWGCLCTLRVRRAQITPTHCLPSGLHLAGRTQSPLLIPPSSFYLVEIDPDAAQIGLGQLASVGEETDDAIITKDLNGIITSWNKGAERVFGYEASEVIGKPKAIADTARRNLMRNAILNGSGRGNASNIMKLCGFARTASSSIFP